MITAQYNGNNGFTDNVIEYIFAKRSPQIALFLADRIYRFYIHDTPTRTELDTIASVILANNFEMLPSIKTILTLELMYSDKAMKSVRYKNPLELYVGSLKKFRNKSFSDILSDPILKDTSILQRLNWVAFFPGSVFGRDGFDASIKWNNTSIQNTWVSSVNYYIYRKSGTGTMDFRELLGNYRKVLTNEVVPVMTHAMNSYTGTMKILSGNYQLDATKFVIQSVTPGVSPQTDSLESQNPAYSIISVDITSPIMNVSSQEVGISSIPEVVLSNSGRVSNDISGTLGEDIHSLDTSTGASS